MIVDVIDYRPNASRSVGQMTEELPGTRSELVGLAVPARQQIDEAVFRQVFNCPCGFIRKLRLE